MLYSLVKPILFSLDPELAHDISLEMLQQFHRVLPARRVDKPTRVMGLDFPNPVGSRPVWIKMGTISTAWENSDSDLSKLAVSLR